ncbi:MAG: Nitrogen regulatory protein P-II, partial [uncultured Ramlibacter sp.]
ETDHRHRQAIQARGSPRGPGRVRRHRADRHRGQGLWPAEGPHRAVPGRRVRGGLPAQGEGRGGRQGRRRRALRGPDRQGGPHRQDRRRQDLHHLGGAGGAHPHRRDRRIGCL